jgi:hypothetical protein
MIATTVWCNCNCWSDVIATYVKRLSLSWRKRGVGGKVKKFCRERAGATKTTWVGRLARTWRVGSAWVHSLSLYIYIYI